MSVQHKVLSEGGWAAMPFVEQMANIGSEVERALRWRAKTNFEYSRQAFERALELIDFTMGDSRNLSRLKEIARAREVLVDFFFGDNRFSSTPESWSKYFMYFAYAARKNR
ncbi:MAG: hypothetical protein A2251_04810 [Elusimicrobia bacterium RIFOXYA2_FULL_47_53]|nr:MAG: hypothetical protein A2278_05925 [Elusimicrobia bacterium RIFOXYA12_FULL_49_49]OGS11315.1 MAG: hypothetical protein A2386_08345 [Elusimicrobia bacterium RIFOXYB1_FULL_48_9]OGS16668.1 MAG: hypothetical protein A2251_04810 [Elusimicrobia bacterium RIFOXYA2_FULL_47_53]OGS31646.1 MAG: hypothetical protein A2323_03530 [Elusimicrobia bacterium RIFOXYB2_FULL_46_23]